MLDPNALQKQWLFHCCWALGLVLGNKEVLHGNRAVMSCDRTGLVVSGYSWTPIPPVPPLPPLPQPSVAPPPPPSLQPLLLHSDNFQYPSDGQITYHFLTWQFLSISIFFWWWPCGSCNGVALYSKATNRFNKVLIPDQPSDPGY